MAEEGYNQAIENLAYYIREASEESQMPIIDANEWILDEEPETQIEFIDSQMTDEQRKKWDELNYIMDVVSITYKVAPHKVYEDVGKRVMEPDLQAWLN